MTGNINFVSDTIGVVAVDATYTENLSTHDNLDDIGGSARVATSALSNQTATDGVADCDDIVFTAVTGDDIVALVLYLDTGVESTSSLIAYIETGTVSPNGTDITFVVDSGANKLFKL